MSQDDAAAAASSESPTEYDLGAVVCQPSVTALLLGVITKAMLTAVKQVDCVLQDSLHNIIHDVVLTVHRTEKQLRMSSAATQISVAAQQNLQSPHPANDTPTKSSGSSFPSSQSGRSGKYDTTYATYNDGIISLKGNPLVTTASIYCPQCRLPRLMYPLTGAGAQMPDDLSAQYCNRHPYVSKHGHDIWGNPFPSDQAKTKKERDLLKQQQRTEKDSTPASQNSDPTGGTQEELQNGISKLIPQGKGANYIPWHTCPRCKRSLLITRFAQHLEKCLGISGRQSSRNAMAKLSGQNGSIASTPMGSRPGTPAPGSAGGSESKGQKRDREEDDGDDIDDAPLKKLKKRAYTKKADRERLAAQSSQDDKKEDKEKPDKKEGTEGVKLMLKMKSAASGSPSKDSSPSKKPPKPGGAGVKRESDGDKDDEGTPKKKLKITSTED